MKRGIFASFKARKHEFTFAEKVFSFDHVADFVSLDDWVFIFQHSRFEGMTGMQLGATVLATRALDELNRANGIEIAAIDELKRLVETKPALARRLASAAQQKIFAAHNGERLAARIKQLSMKVHVDRKKSKYTFSPKLDDPAQVEQFVNVLCDYYLRSPATSIEYRVPAKYRD